MTMKSSKIFAGVTIALLNIALCTVAVGQDHATAQEVVAKVREAASALSKTGDLKQFDQKSGPWVWKDTYIFIQDCSKKVMAAHPIKPEMVGQDLSSVKDAKTGKSLFPDSAAYCKQVQDSPSGVWGEYWWPKPGATEPSRKIAYHLAAKGTPYIVNAGIYSDTATVKELSKVSSMK
ncbi:MAG: cache domain-containing protein [Terriglobales bacterium]